jgi:hypothetical protein
MTTVKELRNTAKGLGMTGYSVLNKAELEDAIAKAKECVAAMVAAESPVVPEGFKEFKSAYNKEQSSQILANCSKSEKDITPRQHKMLLSLEDNYCIKLDWSEIRSLSMAQASEKITNILNAIETGSVAKRSAQAAAERVLAHSKVVEEIIRPSAITEAQTKYIVSLQDKLNINVELPEGKDDASQMIKKLESDVVRLQARERIQKEQEVKAPAPEVKFSFMNAVNMYFKRMFA